MSLSCITSFELPGEMTRKSASLEDGINAALAAQDKAFAIAIAAHIDPDDLSEALSKIDQQTDDFLIEHTGMGVKALYSEGYDIGEYRDGFVNTKRAYAIL